MNTFKFYWTYEVLGVQAVLKPLSLRSVYKLSRPLAQQTDFLFFCEPLKTTEAKDLVKKIAGPALKAEEEQVVEVLDFKSNHLAFLLKNILNRFTPSKGFIVFGEELANKLIKGVEHPLQGLSSLKVCGSTHLSFPLDAHKKVLVSGCVIPSIQQLTDPNSEATQKAKQSAWQILHKTFLQIPPKTFKQPAGQTPT